MGFQNHVTQPVRPLPRLQRLRASILQTLDRLAGPDPDVPVGRLPWVQEVFYEAAENVPVTPGRCKTRVLDRHGHWIDSFDCLWDGQKWTTLEGAVPLMQRRQWRKYAPNATS